MELDNHAIQPDAAKTRLDYFDVKAPKLPVPNLSAALTETKDHMEVHLPPLAISTGNAALDFARGMGQNFVHSAVQSPLEGAAQTFDHTLGSSFDTHLYAQTKDLIVVAPKPADFGTAEWHGQSIGAALGLVPWFLATKNAVRGGAGLFSASRGFVVSEAEAAMGSKLMSGTGAKLMLEGGVTGAAYAGAFKPVDAGSGNYWSAKAATMAGDFASFATLSGTSLALSPVLKSASLPLMERYPDSSKLIGRATSILSGSLSGIPAAGLETVTEHLQSGGNAPLSLEAFGKNVYSFGIVGGALSSRHSGGVLSPGHADGLLSSVHAEGSPSGGHMGAFESLQADVAEVVKLNAVAEAKATEAKTAEAKTAEAKATEAKTAEAKTAESVAVSVESKTKYQFDNDHSGQITLGGGALTEVSQEKLKQLKQQVADYIKVVSSVDTLKVISKIPDLSGDKKHAPVLSWKEADFSIVSHELPDGLFPKNIAQFAFPLADAHEKHDLFASGDNPPFKFWKPSEHHHEAEPEPETQLENIMSAKDVSYALDSIPNAEHLHAVLGNDRGVGELPEPFVKAGLSQKEAFEKLDALATSLRALDTGLPPQKKFGLGAQDLNLPSFSVGMGDSTMQISKVAIGEVAHVYKLSLDGQDFAFKVPNDPGRLDVHGSFAETAAFAWLSRHAISDLVDFHAARPGTRGGWMLTEFVSQPVERGGLPIAGVLAKHGLKLGDDWSANRGPGNVAWDLGGIEPIDVPNPKSVAELSELLDTMKGQVIAGRKLDAITDQTELKAALLFCLEHASLGGQVARSAALNLEAPADLADVLSKALETDGAAGRAAFELDRLAETPYITALFHKALLHPESRVEAVKQISKLPPEDRKEAFDAAMIYQEARAMAARSIPSIPDEEGRADAAAAAAQFPGSNFVLYHNLAKDRALSADELAAKQQAFEEHFENYGLKTGDKLTKDEPPLGFEKWWQDHFHERESMPPEDMVESQIKGIWHNLKESHKALGIDELAAVSRSFHKLEPSNWQSMTAHEAVEFANLIENLALSHGEERTIFQHADLRKFLVENLEAINENSSYYNVVRTIDDWENLPGDYRKLDALSLMEITDMGDTGYWTKVPAAEAAEWARTISSLHLSRSETQRLLNKPEFVQWYNQYLDQGEELSQTGALTVLNVWERMTPEQKSLPSLELVGEANTLQTRMRLESAFGPDSPAVEYLLSPDAVSNNLPSVVIPWFEMYAGQAPARRQMAQKIIEQLVKDGAPAASFERTALQNNCELMLLYPDRKQFREKLTQNISDPENLARMISFIKTGNDTIKMLVELAIEKYDFDGNQRTLKKISDTAMFANILGVDADGAAYLLDQRFRGVRFNYLERYLESGVNAKERVRSLVSQRAEQHQINGRYLADQDVLRTMTDFSEAELDKLAVLQKAGLPAMHLKEHLIEAPHDLLVVARMLADGASVKEFRNYLRMSVLPSEVNQKLVAAIKDRQLALEDVMQGLKDWQSGRDFHNLLIAHVESGAPISTGAIEDLRARAQSAPSPHPGLSEGRTVENEESQAVANTFLDALKGIKETIPPKKPIVLLGRDAWPLVPLLRASGRDARYFLWSRLQNDDEGTKRQWLKEVPPGAAVIDTGFSGSIINGIRKIDPDVSGYLLSTSDTNKYPRLLSGEHHSAQVNRVEEFPKLIFRSSAHTELGNTVSRPKDLSDDEYIPPSLELSSHWRTERRAREVLRAAGLPEWDVWRYGQFTGLTPTERLALRNRSELEPYYQSVQLARSLRQPDNAAVLAPAL